MTLQELYDVIGGDYEQVTRILRMEKLIDKHVRKLKNNDLFSRLAEAGESMDATDLFETSHAIKGVCGNLGLKDIADKASTISEEFRPGNARAMSDDEVRALIGEISDRFAVVVDGIAQYEKA